MPASPAANPSQSDSVPVWRRRPAVPSWALSLLLHLAAIVTLGTAFSATPMGTGAPDRLAEVGIALKHTIEEREYYQSEDSGPEAHEESTAEGLAELLAAEPSVAPMELMPELPAIGPGALLEGIPDANLATAGPPGRLRPSGGATRTSVFGLEGEGSRFVYVFDRSGSMGGIGRSALDGAKAELLASLEHLEPSHQFQVIFYNHLTWRFQPRGQPVGGLVFATERNLEHVRRFVNSITADGGTDHVPALMEAISLGPDVIFFLTDADEPQITAGQLERIARRAAGITIHCIEFGFGPHPGGENFIARLARQNMGRYGYVDVTRLSR